MALALSFTPFFQLAEARTTPDWSSTSRIEKTGRSNPFGIEAHEWEAVRNDGLLHTAVYPVTVTGTLIPKRPVERMLDEQDRNPIFAALQALFKWVSPITSTQQAFQWLGLHPYPEENETGIYAMPYPEGKRPNYLMGITHMNRFGAEGVTFGCAACHSSRLFGKTIIGLTNRFPRANEFFILGKTSSSAVLPAFFALGTHANASETEMYAQMRNSVQAVEAKKPLVQGLDTSLAQTALSLAHRNSNAYATKNAWLERFPRSDRLDTAVADSKPAVWWNVKYKTRWLLDGSIISGNPIFTNFLWNEIGRGTDLEELEGWLSSNSSLIDNLTTAIFSNEAPPITDFFSANKINLAQAKRGEVVFNDTCARCHGKYEKGWSKLNSEKMPLRDQLKTTQVYYFEKTPVKDVGTDPMRALGMTSLAKALNPLAISQKHGIVIQPQKGYVPPPLVGIWARWPYFHNNSAPNLCAVLSPANERPTVYAAGEAEDRERDYDWDCAGYPTGDKTPSAWWTTEGRVFDTRRTGLSNAGHDEGIFLEEGKPTWTREDKMAVIEFLKTL